MRTYLFDLDGTLLDSIELILHSFHHTTRIHMGRELGDAYWLRGVGTPLRDQLATVAQSAAELQAMLDTYRTYNLESHDRMARPYPGVVEVVRRLQERGSRLGLVTSKLSTGAERGLKLLRLEDSFSVRICADDVARGKPDPEPVLKALSALSEEPEEAVFIGDSLHDVQSGKRAGVRTAVVTWGPFGRAPFEEEPPDHWLEQPEDILSL
jgi:pyrophosphatase PpaX